MDPQSGRSGVLPHGSSCSSFSPRTRRTATGQGLVTPPCSTSVARYPHNDNSIVCLCSYFPFSPRFLSPFFSAGTRHLRRASARSVARCFPNGSKRLSQGSVIVRLWTCVSNLPHDTTTVERRVVTGSHECARPFHRKIDDCSPPPPPHPHTPPPP